MSPYETEASSYLLSAINYQLSAISYQLSAISYQLQVTLILNSESRVEASSVNHVARVVGLDPCMLVSSKDSLNVAIRG